MSYWSISINFDLVSNNIENHERLRFRTSSASAGLKFDSILYLKDKTLSRNGFIEYIYDLTPDIDHNVRSHIDNVSVKKTIKTHHYIITISLQIKILNQTRLKLQM